MAVCGLLLAVVGISLLCVAIAMPAPHVTAVRVTAVVQTGGAPIPCEAGRSIKVSFDWAGQRVTESLDLPKCSRIYQPGQQVALYAASNDPSNLGTTSDWILNPDEHDPFAFIGPNDLPTFVGLAGAAVLFGGGIISYFAWQRRSPTVPAA
jgi:hypothetical protein